MISRYRNRLWHRPRDGAWVLPKGGNKISRGPPHFCIAFVLLIIERNGIHCWNPLLVLFHLTCGLWLLLVADIVILV